VAASYSFHHVVGTVECYLYN